MVSETPDNSPAPRRSQRERKVVKPFAQVANQPNKGKRKRRDSVADGDDLDGQRSENGGHDPEDEEVNGDENEDDYRAPKTKTPTKKSQSKTTTPKPKGPPPTKKPRIVKPLAQKSIATRKSKKPQAENNAYDAVQVAKDTKITADNPLFNAVVNPSAALQSTAEDFLESLEQNPGTALAELVNLILRACGCNDSVNADEVLDYDGVVDALDNFTEGLKQENSPIYPLTSKLPIFKKFRRSLSEFIERLIASSADLGVLYTSDLMETLQSWVVAMSSSQIRSFRHTATVVALEVETALCDVAATVEKEAEVVGRQREGEKKRKSSNKGSSARDKELETKAQEIRKRRAKLSEFLKEFVDGVFVHRYRDLDPNIRAECVRSIGLWFKKFPSHFLDVAYLRYVGWVLSDSNTHVRLEAVKSLSGVYDQSDYINSLNHFTERFKPRLIEMATSDTETPVRVAVIQILGAIDSHSLLEDEEREKLCLLVFDEEVRVRKAVSHFVRGVWEEAVDERLVGKNKPSNEDRQHAGLKAFALLLVKWSKALDKIAGDEGTEVSDEEDPTGEASAPIDRWKGVTSLLAIDQRGRTALAVEALWDEVDAVRDWEPLLDILLLDHSAAEGEETQETNTRRSRGRANGKISTPDSTVDEAWRLDDSEESVLLEVLVTTLRRAKLEAVGSKKGEDEIITNDITRELIKGLPRLFIKYQADQNRIADVLIIPTLMNLDLYLEMRMITSYASLWDDVAKQFLSHSSMNVLTHAMGAIRYFMDATSLSNTNNTKILELEDELSTLLRDTVAGREEIEVASFNEDEIISLGALCTRLAVLSGSRNITSWIEEDEGGKQSSAWDILSALIERGRLGYKEEELMIGQALHVLTLHIIWKGRGLTSDSHVSSDGLRIKETLVAQRQALLDKLIEYAIGTQSNTADNVKRAAFKDLLDLHVLFFAGETTDVDQASSPLASIALSLDDEIQYRCAGYVQAEIERYADIFGVAEDSEKDQESSDDSGGEQLPDDHNVKKSGERRKKSHVEIDTTSQSRLEQEYLFIDVMSTFLRAIRVGAISIRHGSTLLAHYGRLGPAFDACSKVIVDALREEGMMNTHGDTIVSVITQSLREAYELVLDNVVHDVTNCLHLSKLLATCFVIRGSQLSIIRRLNSQHVVHIHTELLSWVAQRLAVYNGNKNKKSMKIAVLFFKALVPLLGVISSRDALKIKAHMDQVLAQAKLDISPTSKLWEPQRAYEKRLTTAMSKDKGIGPGGRKSKSKGVKSAAGVSSDEGTDGEELTETETNEPQRTTRSRLKTQTAIEPSAEDMEHTTDEDEPGLAPNRRRPQPRPLHQKSPFQTPEDDVDGSASALRSPVRSAVADNEERPLNGVETPKVSRKRMRASNDLQTSGVGAEVPQTPEEETLDSEALRLAPSADGEIQIRRKRVRH